jgi:hypothetical protein
MLKTSTKPKIIPNKLIMFLTTIKKPILTQTNPFIIILLIETNFPNNKDPHRITSFIKTKKKTNLD